MPFIIAQYINQQLNFNFYVIFTPVLRYIQSYHYIASIVSTPFKSLKLPLLFVCPVIKLLYISQYLPKKAQKKYQWIPITEYWSRNVNCQDCKKLKDIAFSSM